MLFSAIQMANERFILAVSRLEAALARVEAAVARQPESTDPADFAALAERHDRLHAGATEALARLDALIESGGVAGQGD